MPEKVVTSLEEILERRPGRSIITNSASGVAWSGEWVAAKVVVDHPEALEGVPRGHLERSILGRDLVLVKVVCGSGVDDDGVGRRHDDYYLFGTFVCENLVFMFISPPGSNDNYQDQMTIIFWRFKKCVYFLNDEFHSFERLQR